MADERSRVNPSEWPVERVLGWIDAGCVLFDARLECVYANEQGGGLFGVAPADLVGRSLSSPFAAPLAAEFQRVALPAFASRTPSRATLQDESTGRWFDVALHPSADGLLAIAADVTAAKREALETAAHHDYLQQLVDQLPAFLWVIDHDLIVRRIEGGRPMLEALDRDRLIGLPMADVTRMGSSPEDLKLSVDMHRRVLAGESEQYRATWKGLVIHARIEPLRDRDGTIVGIVGVGVDVTKEAGLESQLRQSQKLEAIGQLAGGVAHDFNNVLAAISGYAHLLFDDLAAGDPHRREVAEILKATDRATAITRQLLAFSRHQVPAAVRVDLVELVHDLGRMLRALMPATIALRVAPERGGPPIDVLADRGQLEQVVMNLALNARDAMPDGGTLSVEVRTGTTPDTAHTALLEVRDNGIGMSPDVQAHVFEPFFTTKEPGQGTGLGLATVYGIVRQHSGSIEIGSGVGEGTTVTVRLPIAPPGEAPMDGGAEHVDGQHGGRVLIVEDEAQVRDVTTRFLRRAGYDVTAVADAVAALGLLTSGEPFDLVLTDSAMPGMRGEDLAAEIFRVRPGLPVILMSGYTDPAQPAKSSRVSAFIHKPFSVQALLTLVRRVLARE